VDEIVQDYGYTGNLSTRDSTDYSLLGSPPTVLPPTSAPLWSGNFTIENTTIDINEASGPFQVSFTGIPRISDFIWKYLLVVSLFFSILSLVLGISGQILEFKLCKVPKKIGKIVDLSDKIVFLLSLIFLILVIVYVAVKPTEIRRFDNIFVDDLSTGTLQTVLYSPIESLNIEKNDTDSFISFDFSHRWCARSSAEYESVRYQLQAFWAEWVVRGGEEEESPFAACSYLQTGYDSENECIDFVCDGDVLALNATTEKRYADVIQDNVFQGLAIDIITVRILVLLLFNALLGVDGYRINCV